MLAFGSNTAAHRSSSVLVNPRDSKAFGSRRSAQTRANSRVQRAPGCARRRVHRVSAFQDSSVNQLSSSSTSVATRDVKRQLTVSWAGAGLYFFWQLGAIKYLAEKYDLTKVPMVGASGGALAAVLAACGVNADRVIEHAYALSLKHNIWARPLGLLGVWGSLIEKWLDELLPDNAHEMCRNRITVVVTTLPDMQQVGITDFKDKKDLINACMASSHIPWLLDWSPTRMCRGKRCVDGSFPDFFSGVNCELLRGASTGVANVVFDYFDDAALQRKGRMDMLALKSYDEIRRRYRLGYEYAAKLHEDGKFDHFELAELMAMGKHGHMEEVLVPEHSNGVSATRSGSGSVSAHYDYESDSHNIHSSSNGNGTGNQQPQATNVTEPNQRSYAYSFDDHQQTQHDNQGRSANSQHAEQYDNYRHVKAQAGLVLELEQKDDRDVVHQLADLARQEREPTRADSRLSNEKGMQN